MDEELEFRSDLYRGTSRFYDEFRVPYPVALLDDLCRRTDANGEGRLLDLACGTGQLAFGLASRFVDVCAVDQEPEAIDLARTNAETRGVQNIRWVAGRAEDIDAEGDFDLVVIGNAFHRLPRRNIAVAARRWLVPGGHLALVWSTPPQEGSEEWQHVLEQIMREWIERVGDDRIPAQFEQRMADEPNASVLAAAGFDIVGAFNFPTPYEWSVARLLGWTFSTSVLSQAALGTHVAEFERDVRDRLLRVAPDDVFRETIDFAYILARTG